MRYVFLEGATKTRRSPWGLWSVVALVLAGVSTYGYVLASAPQMAYFDDQSQPVADTLAKAQPVKDHDRLYVPQVNISLAIGADQGATSARIKTYPDDAYALSAPRYGLAIDPWSTHANSPFYHLGELKSGDQIYVDRGGVRYAYKVTSAEASGTLSCQPTGDKKSIALCAQDGDQTSIVVQADQLGTVSWTSGSPHIEAF